MDIAALIPLISQLAPFVVQFLSNTAVQGQVVAAVQKHTGASDAAAAHAKVSADPAAAAALQAQLAKIAADAATAQQQEVTKRIQAALADVANARGMAVAGRGGPMEWGAPLVSVLVLAGFTAVAVLSSLHIAVDPQIIGCMVALATTVVSFWVGSSRGSQRKDDIIAAMPPVIGPLAKPLAAPPVSEPVPVAPTQPEPAKPAPVASTAPSVVVDPALVAAVKAFEGFQAKATWDYKQYTNGYGTVASGADEVVTEAVAEQRLMAELGKAAAAVEKFAPDAPKGVKQALTDLSFNAGTGWMKAGLGSAVKAGNWADAKARLLQYDHAGGQVLEGLKKRREAEAGWFENPL